MEHWRWPAGFRKVQRAQDHSPTVAIDPGECVWLQEKELISVAPSGPMVTMSHWQQATTLALRMTGTEGDTCLATGPAISVANSGSAMLCLQHFQEAGVEAAISQE